MRSGQMTAQAFLDLGDLLVKLQNHYDAIKRENSSLFSFKELYNTSDENVEASLKEVFENSGNSNTNKNTNKNRNRAHSRSKSTKTGGPPSSTKASKKKQQQAQQHVKSKSKATNTINNNDGLLNSPPNENQSRSTSQESNQSISSKSPGSATPSPSAKSMSPSRSISFPDGFGSRAESYETKESSAMEDSGVVVGVTSRLRKISDSSESKLDTLCTGCDSQVVHHVINVPSITMKGLTGDLKKDINNYLTKFAHVMIDDETGKAMKIGYKQAMISDAYFDSTRKVYDIKQNSKNNSGKAKLKNTNSKKTKNSNNNKNKNKNKDQIKLNKEFMWRTNDPNMIGAELIDREWVTVKKTNKKNNKNGGKNSGKNSKNSKNNSKGSNNKNKNTKNNNNNDDDAKSDDKSTFTIMQFNMLADGLSGGYLDTSQESLTELIDNANNNNNSNSNENNDKSDSKTNVLDVCPYTGDEIETAWGDKIEKAFFHVNPLCLQWNYRGLRLVEEILRINCDLCGFEECDQPEFVEKYLVPQGYKLIFQAKQDSPCAKIGVTYVKPSTNDIKDKKQQINNALYRNEHIRFDTAIPEFGKEREKGKGKTKFNLPNDGCAIAYKRNLFEVVSKTIISLSTYKDALDWSQQDDIKCGIGGRMASPKLVKKNSFLTEDTGISVRCSVKMDLYNLEQVYFNFIERKKKD